MADSFLELIQDMVLNNKRPAKVIAENCRRPYKTMMRELNPYDEGAKLGADMVLPLMEQCGDISPIRYLAIRMNYRLIPMNGVEPDKLTMAEELCDDIQAVARCQRALLDVEATALEQAEELTAQAIQELEENLVAFRRLKLMKKAG